MGIRDGVEGGGGGCGLTNTSSEGVEAGALGKCLENRSFWNVCAGDAFPLPG